jgi:hypothetical protein
MGLTPESQNRSNMKAKQTILWVFLCADILILLVEVYMILRTALLSLPAEFDESARTFFREYQATSIVIYAITFVVLICIGVAISLKLKSHK